MDHHSRLRSLPKVDDLLKRPDVADLLAAEPRVLVVEAIRDAIESLRAEVLEGGEPDLSGDAVVEIATRSLARSVRPSLRRVVNATGIIVHTNLGRSPLALDAIAAVVEVAVGYSTLEYDAETGERGSRHAHVEALLCRLTGAEAAMAVNNNAAAVLLALAGLAEGREAIVSRGELVEIGGSFRIPDVTAQSGARVVEVGTTNKTRAADYEAAITDATGVLLKVHPSNFRVVGFTESASLEELVEIGRRRGIPIFEDQGSGVLIDLSPWGLGGEPTIADSVAAGADLVSASGDKLLGGPQAGLIVGTAEAIDRLRRHPLARALRLDKMTLAALQATLALYLEPERARREIPTLAMLTASPEEMARRAAALAQRIRDAVGPQAEVAVAADVSRAGGGALPLAELPTTVVALTPSSVSADVAEARLRAWEPPVVARIAQGRILLDPRTLSGDDEDVVVTALAAATLGA
jgi:L-seryl-tRNA(Ser) seleniumtransferase